MGAKRPKSLVYYNLSYQLFLYTILCQSDSDFYKMIVENVENIENVETEQSFFFFKTLIILTTYFNHLKPTYWCLRKSENIYET